MTIHIKLIALIASSLLLVSACGGGGYMGDDGILDRKSTRLNSSH